MRQGMMPSEEIPTGPPEGITPPPTEVPSPTEVPPQSLFEQTKNFLANLLSAFGISPK